MIRLKSSTMIQRPAKDVTAYVADVENDKAWATGVVHAARTEGKAGQVGAKYERVLEAMGRNIKMVVEVAAHEPGKQVELKGTGKVLEAKIVYRCAPSGSATKLDVEFEGEMLGFASMFEGVVAEHLEAQLPKDLETLRSKLEK